MPIGKTPTGGKQVGWFCVGANDRGTKPGYAFFLKTAEEKPLLPLDFRGQQADDQRVCREKVPFAAFGGQGCIFRGAPVKLECMSCRKRIFSIKTVIFYNCTGVEKNSFPPRL